MKRPIICLLFAWASILCVQSADKSPRTNAPPVAGPNAYKAQGLPFYGKVGAIDRQAQTITLEGKEKTRLFYLTPATRIHRDKKPAKLEEVLVGQWVGGFVRPDADGRPTVVTLNLAVVQRKSSAPETNSVPRKAAQPK